MLIYKGQFLIGSRLGVDLQWTVLIGSRLGVDLQGTASNRK